MTVNERLSEELGIRQRQVDAAVELLDGGNTVPFIARYRKEVTGGLDDEQLRRLSERLSYLRSLEEKRESVLNLINEQGKLTDEIRAALAAASTVTEIDDIYRPFRPKRKTRASVAKERGLEPLARLIFEQRPSYSPSIPEEAEAFVNGEIGVPDAETAIGGALDIIAEEISDSAEYRKAIRKITFDFGFIESKKAADGPVYEQYYDHTERVAKIPAHRVLAINRGEKEGVLKVSVAVDRDAVLNYLLGEVVADHGSPAFPYISRTVCDSYDRLIAPSIEREIRNDLFDAASESAIGLFSSNLKNLLMSAPLKGKTVLGYDPGYRTGCKLAVVTETGKVVATAVIYPTKPHERIEESKKVVKRLVERFGVDVVAIGNGTASGESENADGASGAPPFCEVHPMKKTHGKRQSMSPAVIANTFILSPSDAFFRLISF